MLCIKKLKAQGIGKGNSESTLSMAILAVSLLVHNFAGKRYTPEN